MSDTCSQQVRSSSYKKRLRFLKPVILINEKHPRNISDNGPEYKSWVDGTNMDEKTKNVRWGFGFEAPISKQANAWRWAWVKGFNKLAVFRFTLPHIEYC